MVSYCVVAWCAAYIAAPVDYRAFVAEAHARYEAVVLARGAARLSKVRTLCARRAGTRPTRRTKVLRSRG
jgi:hypothetical protein